MNIAEQLQELKALEKYIEACPKGARNVLMDEEYQKSKFDNGSISSLIENWRVYALHLQHLKYNKYTGGKLSWNLVLNQIDHPLKETAASLTEEELKTRIQETQLAIFAAVIAQEGKLFLKTNSFSTEDILAVAKQKFLAYIYREALVQYRLMYLIERLDARDDIKNRGVTNDEYEEFAAIRAKLDLVNNIDDEPSSNKGIDKIYELSELTKNLDDSYFENCETARAACDKMLADEALKQFGGRPSVKEFLDPLTVWMDQAIKIPVPKEGKNPVSTQSVGLNILELRKIVDDFVKDFESICAKEEEIYPDRKLDAALEKKSERKQALLTLQECLYRNNTYTKDTNKTVTALLKVMHDNEPTWRELSFIHIIWNFLSFGWHVSSQKKDSSFFNHPVSLDRKVEELEPEEKPRDQEGIQA